MPVELLSSETVYEGRAFNILHDRIRLIDGKEASLDIIKHPGAVAILPVDGNGNILFVRQYRHATRGELLEVPAGTLDPNEEPLACAKREIREETGFSADVFVKLGELFLAPGYSTEYMYIYLATELNPGPLPSDDDEFITLEPIPIHQAYSMVMEGKLIDGKSLAALLLARPHLMNA